MRDDGHYIELLVGVDGVALVFQISKDFGNTDLPGLDIWITLLQDVPETVFSDRIDARMFLYPLLIRVTTSVRIGEQFFLEILWRDDRSRGRARKMIDLTNLEFCLGGVSSSHPQDLGFPALQSVGSARQRPKEGELSVLNFLRLQTIHLTQVPGLLEAFPQVLSERIAFKSQVV